MCAIFEIIRPPVGGLLFIFVSYRVLMAQPTLLPTHHQLWTQKSPWTASGKSRVAELGGPCSSFVMAKKQWGGLDWFLAVIPRLHDRNRFEFFEWLWMRSWKNRFATTSLFGAHWACPVSLSLPSSNASMVGWSRISSTKLSLPAPATPVISSALEVSDSRSRGYDDLSGRWIW